MKRKYQILYHVMQPPFYRWTEPIEAGTALGALRAVMKMDISGGWARGEIRIVKVCDSGELIEIPPEDQI